MSTIEMTVKKTTVKPTHVVCKTIRTTMPEITQAIGSIPDEIKEELDAKGIVTGDAIFEYSGYDEATKGITVCIGFPIAKPKDYTGNYEVRLLPEFKCIEGKFVGNIVELAKEAWEVFFGKAIEVNPTLTMNNVGREVYAKWVGPDSNENEVMLQISMT